MKASLAVIQQLDKLEAIDLWNQWSFQVPNSLLDYALNAYTLPASYISSGFMFLFLHFTFGYFIVSRP